jgi:hypothetical protein
MYGYRGGFGDHGGPWMLGLMFLAVLLALAITPMAALVRTLRTLRAPRPTGA